MERIGYYNGEIGALEELKIPLCDRSVFYGDAVYDAVLYLNGIGFTLDLHLDRLYRSCQMTEIPFQMTREKLQEEIHRLMDLTPNEPRMLYLQVTRGAAPRKHEFPKDCTPNLIMFNTPVSLTPLATEASLASMEDHRFEYCNIKTTNLLPNVFAAQKATSLGATEALLHRKGRVTEGSHSSILMIQKGTLVAPPLDEWILPGITRAVTEALCRENQIPVEHRAFTVDEILDADEIFLCSTTKSLLPVRRIDNVCVGGKDPETARRIQDLFRNKVLSQTRYLLP